MFCKWDKDPGESLSQVGIAMSWQTKVTGIMVQVEISRVDS